MDEVDRERLFGWSDIADLLHCDVRTAQRYEKHRKLPVHRIPGAGSPRVFAYKDELQQWFDDSKCQLETNPPLEELNPSAHDPHEAGGHPALPLFKPIAKRPITLSWLALGGLVLALTALGLAIYLLQLERLVAKDPRHLSDGPFPKAPPLLTDGRKIYFQQVRGGKSELHWVSVDGGATQQLKPSLPNPELCAVSPDGAALLLRDVETNKNGDEPLYVQSLADGAPRRIGSILAYDAAWFPDGQRILFSRHHSLYEATAWGDKIRKITDLPGRAYWFRWSPDRKRVRFTVYHVQTSGYRIWEMDDPLTSSPRPVSLGVDNLPQQCCGSWHPDGRAFYFQAFVNGKYQLFAQLYGPWDRWRRTTQLTSGPASIRSPVPLPDGTRVVTLGQIQNAELSVFEPGSDRWLPYLEGTAIATAVWSRDGKWLAYTKLPDHTLWRCRMPGCVDAVPLTQPPLRVTMPRWSPDGTRIACMARLLGEPWRASLVTAHGGTQVTPLSPEGAEADPDWSPSGDSLVYGKAPSPDGGAGNALYLLDLRSQSVQRIPGSRGHHSPRWSPTGDSIAAINAHSMEIGFYSLAARSWTHARVGGRVGYPNWSIGGERLYVLAEVGTDHAKVVSVDPASLQVADVSPLTTLRQPAFSFGDWIGLTPTNQPLALRDLSAELILSWRIE